MTLKENGKVSNKEKRKKYHKQHRDIKCKSCGKIINVDEKIELDDIDYISSDKTKAVFYCDCCGMSTNIIKL